MFTIILLALANFNIANATSATTEINNETDGAFDSRAATALAQAEPATVFLHYSSHTLQAYALDNAQQRKDIKQVTLSDDSQQWSEAQDFASDVNCYLGQHAVNLGSMAMTYENNCLKYTSTYGAKERQLKCTFGQWGNLKLECLFFNKADTVYELHSTLYFHPTYPENKLLRVKQNDSGMPLEKFVYHPIERALIHKNYLVRTGFLATLRDRLIPKTNDVILLSNFNMSDMQFAASLRFSSPADVTLVILQSTCPEKILAKIAPPSNPNDSWHITHQETQ